MSLPYVVGVVCGDGWINKYRNKRVGGHHYRVGLDVTNREFAEEFKHALQALSRNKIQFFKCLQRSRNRVYEMYRVYVNDKTLYNEVRNILSNIYEYVRNLDRDDFGRFLRGFWQSDGWLTIPKGRPHDPRIWIANTDIALLKAIGDSLEKYGIKPCLYIRKQHPNSWGRKNIGFLVIYGRRKVEAFLKLIGEEGKWLAGSGSSNSGSGE